MATLTVAIRPAAIPSPRRSRRKAARAYATRKPSAARKTQRSACDSGILSRTAMLEIAAVIAPKNQRTFGRSSRGQARGRVSNSVEFVAFSILPAVEGGFGAFGGDPEDLLRGLREVAEHEAATAQGG